MARYPLSLPQQLKLEAEDLAGQQGVSLNQFILWAVAEKVGALRAEVGDAAFPGITYRPGADGRPTPVVRGRGTRVQTLAVAATHWSMAPAEISQEFDLTEKTVREALAFYTAHQEEVDALIAADEAAEANAR